MPARKSNASVAEEEPGLSVEDLNLPKTMVNRLAKGALPPNFNVQSVAQSAISKSATVFVNYLTAHASDIAARQNKKTIHPKDVLDALKELEFDMFIDRTNNELNKYQEIQCTKRNTYRRRVKDEKRAAEAAATGGVAPSSSAPDGATNGSSAHEVDENGEPVAKKARVDLENGDHDMMDDEGEQDEGEDEEGEEEEEEQEEEEEEEEDEDEGEDEEHGDKEDLLEEKAVREEEDEALDGEESD
ncbi:hypothetical protein SLS56_009856 [Neofusicoccum ribis]|uniref:DNA polymerase epsilon subunit D n=1 Tax=Neofusicoccum ribis TaxID=45134 RepID=A0ABR3SG22_9PEZI